MPAISESNTSVRLRFHGSASVEKANLKQLFILIPYILLTFQQENTVLATDDFTNWKAHNHFMYIKKDFTTIDGLMINWIDFGQPNHSAVLRVATVLLK